MTKRLIQALAVVVLLGAVLVARAWIPGVGEVEMVAPVEAANVDHFGALRQKLLGFRTLYLHASYSGWHQLVAPGKSDAEVKIDGQGFMIYVDAERQITADVLIGKPPGRYFWDRHRFTHHDGSGNPKTVPAASVFLKPFLDDAFEGFPGATVTQADPANFGVTKSFRREGAAAWYQLHSDERWASGLTILLMFANYNGELRSIIVQGDGIPVDRTVGGFRIEIAEMTPDVGIPPWDVDAGQIDPEDWFRPEIPAQGWCRPAGYLVTNWCLPPHLEEARAQGAVQRVWPVDH